MTETEVGAPILRVHLYGASAVHWRVSDVFLLLWSLVVGALHKCRKH